MKIGNEVYIHGFVDEIRKDTVIIRNKGGYFGTDAEEVAPTVERKKGKWIRISDEPFADRFECSECGKLPPIENVEWRLSDYCPNCGADMRGEEGYVFIVKKEFVNVVRCKDCKYGRPWTYMHTKEYVTCEVDCDPIDRDSDFFCAYGKRKDNESSQ